MTITLPPGLRSAITAELVSVIRELVRDPDFSFRVRGISMREFLSTFTTRRIRALVITIETNNRSLLLGQFTHLQKGGMRGFHNNYLAAKIECLLEKEYGPSADFEIHFEVVLCEPSFTYAYRPIDFDTAVAAGLLSQDSRLAQAMKRYSLNTLILAGCEISGPVYGMLKTVEKVCRHTRVRRCLDLFSGTGSLAKVALENGAKFVDCVDTDMSLIRVTLRAHAEKYRAREADVFGFVPDGSYDLAILDPFYDYALRTAEEVLPRIRCAARLAIFNLGLRIDGYWVSLVKERVRRVCPKVNYSSVGENLIAVLKF